MEHVQRALRLSPLDPINFNNYVALACAHALKEEYEEAIVLFKRALEERPHAEWIYRNLTASLYGAGRNEEAQDAFAHLMKIYPDLTVSNIKNAMPFSGQFMDRMCEHLQQLGLPD